MLKKHLLIVSCQVVKNDMSNALVSIQVVPRTPDQKSVIPYVDQAISLIDQAGVAYRVGPLETTMEGELHQLLEIVAQINEEMVNAGCSEVISQVKVYYRPEGASMEELTKKYD